MKEALFAALAAPFQAVSSAIAGLVNAQDPTKSPRIAAFLVGVASGVVWISVWTARGPRDGNLVAAFVAFFGLVGLTKVFGNDDPPRPA